MKPSIQPLVRQIFLLAACSIGAAGGIVREPAAEPSADVLAPPSSLAAWQL